MHYLVRRLTEFTTDGIRRTTTFNINIMNPFGEGGKPEPSGGKATNNNADYGIVRRKHRGLLLHHNRT